MVLVLLLSMAVLSAVAPVSARDITTYAYITASPNPTGINQEVLVTMWLSIPPPTTVGQVGERWQGFTVKITMPDGSVENKGPYTSDPVGFSGFFYTPSMLGTYTFDFNFPGQTTAGDHYSASNAPTYRLTVQQNRIEPIADLPFTNDFWTRPIYAENRNWFAKTGNWLMAAYDTTLRFFDQGSAFAPDIAAPKSAHIMWTKPITDGGLIGGQQYTSTSYYTGMSYEMKLTGFLAINGRYYYNLFPADQAPGFACLDLRTGQELWRNTEERIDIGQIYDYESPNQHGGQAYLWSLGSTNPFISSAADYKMFDAFTGTKILSITNVTGGTVRFSPVGDLLSYVIGTDWLALWNSSKCIGPLAPTGSEAYQWRPWTTGAAGPLDWKRGIEWNVTVPAVPGQSIHASITDPDVILAYAYTPGSTFFAGANPWFLNIGYNAHTGERMWVQNRTFQESPQLVWQILDYSLTGDKQAKVYSYTARDQAKTYGFSLTTGEQLWVTDQMTDAWSVFPGGQVTAYGKLFYTSYAGKVLAYDLKTGKLNWEYSAGNSGVETPYGSWPFYSGLLVADGKVFASNGEHSPSTPLWKGEKLHVINVDNGNLDWSISGWFISHGNIVADGYFVGLNGYDNQLYCFGKGSSAATVSVTPKVVSKGSAVLIEGTVTDQSTAQPGTPCVSLESMTPWMEYLHHQKPIPTHVTGVPVHLTAHKPDGTSIEIGTIMSDTTGFKAEWTPPDNALYTIVADFAGTESYGSSSAFTALSVRASTSSTPAPTNTSSSTDLYIIVATIIVLIAIAIAIVLLRRKQ